MIVEHFTKSDLTIGNLESCFLDPKGNLIFAEYGRELGIHEELANEIITETFGEQHFLDNYRAIRKCGMYTYNYLEKSLGYWRYCHWVGCNGTFVGDKRKLTHAQKLAIREFCKVNSIAWEDAVKI